MTDERNRLEGDTERWRMSRVGLLNFWYYDEEIFETEEGRLILRGANGSGKSVTMQSFLPLVLDGDKRSHRLDPFGSRDRRIEYYLLGEADSGKTDVTGYLWMEFVQPSRGLTKTIGIGLRARRGAASVQFWGFRLDNGRRIGESFWLYDRNRWLETQERVPYGRTELEKEIGSGGEVVHDQAGYRDMVNKHLFGFADAESFQDLLHLLIQLRSPKLSKDFKPSAIYEILHGSLPPLQEDDLRPLSEVLEDMDQIADRLDELRLHKRDTERLNDVYDRYNKRMLYDLSTLMLERHAEYGAQRAKTSGMETMLAEAEEAKHAAAEEGERADAELKRIAAELDVLENHEAIGKQRELEAATAAQQDTEQHLKRARERVDRQNVKQATVDRELEDQTYKRDRLTAEQQETLQELETVAQELEFAEHAVYHRYWERGDPEHDGWREPWRRDLRRHREALEKALAKAREEQEAARLAAELERELGAARKERDTRERDQAEAARLLEGHKEALREAVVVWRGSLRELPYGDERLRRSFESITAFGQDARSPETIRAPMAEALAEKREMLTAERLRLQHGKSELEDERERLQSEKQSWEAYREPEPARSEARARRRSGLPAGSGAPLYAVCDFRTGLGGERQTRIEEALERAGLLDAWISPDGRVGAAAEGQEDVWIAPSPHEFGYTLADVLVPSPPEDSGLSEETIHTALRTFLWVEEGDVADFDGGGAVVSGSGYFRLGPLSGSAASKSRAEYIGKETREQTRRLEIERLQRELEQLGERLRGLEGRLSELQERERLLLTEAESFPSAAELEQSLQSLLETSYRLQAALDHESRVVERFKEKSVEWREAQRQLSELTAGWTRLKRLKDLEEALSASKDYESAIGELYSLWSRCVETSVRIEALRTERQSLSEAIEDDESMIDELDERLRSLRAQVASLRSVMEELGLADVSRRIVSLKSERAGLVRELRAIQVRLEEAKEASARADASVRLYREREEELEQLLEEASAGWHRELKRRLVPDWRDVYVSVEDREAAVRLGADIRQRYDAAFSGRNADTLKNSLLELYNEVRGVLTDYVLEAEIDEETGRILIRSQRDRARPQSLQLLLEELTRDEEQQRLLLSEKDRELYEEIILRSVGKAIRQRIHRAESWVRRMNRLMEERNTSSGLRLKLDWDPKAAQNEQQLDTSALVELLKRDSHRLREDEIDAMIQHFRSQIGYAKQSAQSEKESLRKHLYEVLDYRNWFQFELKYRKGEQTGYRPLTDSRFNVLSGGEKAMAMYIPLFAATWSRYSDARADAPKLISLDEAFAGVDEENMRDMFQLLTEMGFDYMMTSQVLWGCYDTVPKLAIYEIYRPKDVDFVTLFHYRWNGQVKEYVHGRDEAG
ncbi:TIGR02680 family protein [Cohnella sp. 56]|uniref:TIGR02680 family protein n=1 Tax=Cohnella sp. 56 TaxID=3113722 RepID=UPI0030EA6316